MSSYFENLCLSDPLFRNFVASRSENGETFSEQERANMLREYFSIPFKEYYKRRMVFLANKKLSSEAYCV